MDDDDIRADNVVDAVERVEHAVGRLEYAIKDKWSNLTGLVWVLLVILLWDVPGNIWHSKWRYALANGISSDNVVVEKHPHDCAFLAAPLGEKYCHYDREVSTLRRGTSTTGNRLVSYDEGKTWSVVESDPTVTNWPQSDTVVVVYINWKKIEE
jgi:hypothetical protein